MESRLFFKCLKCGNIVALVNDGSGELFCCGDPMIALVANSVDASREKHVPVAVKNNGVLEVSVGSVLHPMTAEHYIQWVAIATENKLEFIYLKPGDEPKASFMYSVKSEDVKVINPGADEEMVPNCEGSPCNFSFNELAANTVSVYAYCNLHGLWKVIL